MKELKSIFDILVEDLPESWNGIKIKTDFRQVLKFFKLLRDKEVNEQEKALIIIKLFFDRVPDTDGIWDFIDYYINCGKTGNEHEDNKRLFDFEIDAGRIYSAFYQTYGIDLTTVKMHWWKFFELFQNLSSETKFLQVIELRGRKPGKNDSAEYKRDLRKLQDAFRLDDEKPKSLASFFNKW